MKNKFLKIVFTFLFVTIAFAQNQNNHWQLGVSDVNFATNPPTVSAIANNGQYGKATISDSAGNLLFYTNGQAVWNKNHAIMTNGDNTNFVNPARTVLIVPNPVNSNQYYIFRANTITTLGSSWWSVYTYSIVEFNLANPLGILLSINTNPNTSFGTESNYSIQLKDIGGTAIENSYDISPLTIAKNTASDGYWIIGQKQTSVVSYKLDNAGLASIPIESTFTDAQIYNPGVNLVTPGNGGLSIRGRIEQTFKMSPDNSKLGALIITSTQNSPSSSSSDFYTLNFNSSTGAFSSFTPIHSEYKIMLFKMLQSFEFSDNSNNVYFIRTPFYFNGGPQIGEIIVKDMINLSNTARVLNLFGNTSTFPASFSFLQRDKFGNLLISSTYADSNRNMYFHKIDSQNFFNSSSVVLNSISLNGNPISSLPQIIPIISIACPNTLLLTQNATSGFDKRQAAINIEANNTISGASTTAIYHAGDSVILAPGFNVLAGSIFRGYIEGCTGVFVARTASNNNITEIAANTKISSAIINLKINPNPANEFASISFIATINNASITRLIDGRTVFNQKSVDSTNLDIDVSTFEKGIYVVTAETLDGVQLTSKFVKN